MPYRVLNIFPLPAVRVKKDQTFFTRTSQLLFILLFLFSFQWKASSQMTTNTSLVSAPAVSCLNQPVVFTATVNQPSATGNVTFWEDSTLLGTASLDASGVAALTLSNLTAGTHTIIAMYEGVPPFDGSISDTIIHTVSSAPVITSQPISQSVFNGCNPPFSVTVDGTAPFTYQWKKNGVNIPNTNSPTFTINNVTAADAGNYSIVVTNSCGSVTSNPASLTLTARPSANISYSTNQWCSSVTTQQTVTRTGAAGGTYSARSCRIGY